MAISWGALVKEMPQQTYCMVIRSKPGSGCLALLIPIALLMPSAVCRSLRPFPCPKQFFRVEDHCAAQNSLR